MNFEIFSKYKHVLDDLQYSTLCKHWIPRNGSLFTEMTSINYSYPFTSKVFKETNF